MAFNIGTVKCQCQDVMGMPSDYGECETCGEKKFFFGSKTYTRLEAWAKDHSKTHDVATVGGQ